MPAAPSDPILFLGGVERSGTTLLRNMLDAHPLLAVPRESYFVIDVYAALQEAGRIDDVELAWDMIRHHAFFVAWELGEEPVVSMMKRHPPGSYADLVRVIFAAYAESEGKPFSADKTPVNALKFRLLAQLFPNSRFVHVVRDPREVCMSLTVQFWHRHGISAAATRWAITVRDALRARENLEGRLQEVRYERLIADPERELSVLCSFAGLSFDSAMLRYGNSASLPSGTHHTRSRLAPSTGARRWQDWMSAQDIGVIECRCARQMAALGYQRVMTRPPARAAASALVGHIIGKLDWWATVRAGDPATPAAGRAQN